MNDQRIDALEARLKHVEATLKAERERNRELVRAHLELIETLQKDHRLTVKRMDMLVKDYQKVYQWVAHLYRERDEAKETSSSDE